TRLISMLSFSFSMSVFLIFSIIPKRVITQSLPLFVTFFSIFVCKLKRNKVILNVSYLLSARGKEVLIMRDGTSYRILEKVEKFNYKKSNLILGQSVEICEHINKKVKTKTILYRNYPKFQINQDLTDNSSNKIHVVYAGLLGVAQGI